MFYQLLDLIVCPVCQSALVLVAPSEQPQRTAMYMPPAQRASPAGAMVGPLPAPAANGETPGWRLLAPLAARPAQGDRREFEVGVVEGLLMCVGCDRWYPVRAGLPELLPDHLREWADDRAWLAGLEPRLAAAGLTPVWEHIWSQAQPQGAASAPDDEGAHYKKAEMAVTRRQLPHGFFGPALVAPFFPAQPNFSLDLLARYATTVSRLDCGLRGTVLDIGVGYAWTTEWLARLGYQAIGFDITRAYLEAGLPRLQGFMPHLFVADNENLPLRAACIEATLSFDAFHHLPNRPRAMQEFDRVMRPGAKVVLVEPGIEHEAHPQSVAVMEQHGILERGFDRAALEGYLQGTGLGRVAHHRSDAHPHDIFVVQKAGTFETDSRSPRALVAEITVHQAATRISAGQSPTLDVSLTNLGDTLWLNTTPDGHGEVYLGASLYNGGHSLLHEDYARVRLTRALRPGQRLRLQMALPALPQPGAYVIELDLVDSGLLRFKQYGYQPVFLSLAVVGEAASTDSLSAEAAGALPLTPVEVGFEPTPIVGIASPATGRRTPLARVPGAVWQVLKTEGPLALARRGLAYFRRK